MRRDSIFYKLFQLSPTLIFELLPDPPLNTEGYRFDSVAVKEPTFEIDGVVLPPEGEIAPVYFVEVQFQKDERLYERVLAESALYFYRNRKRFSDWLAVIIYPSRKTEQSDLYPHRRMIDSGQFYRVFLDELGDIHQLPIWVALMVLTTVKKTNSQKEAKRLLARAKETKPSSERNAIIDMIITIVSYRFGQASRQEVEKMLDISFKETRVYKEIKAEIIEQGRAEGRAEGEATLILKLLSKRFGDVPSSISDKIRALPLPDLESLGEGILDFKTLDAVRDWLESH